MATGSANWHKFTVVVGRMEILSSKGLHPVNPESVVSNVVDNFRLSQQTLTSLH
ncbi:hypothetical protein [Rufibacter sp. XAAS-G3-1]|uniref:hypothetical protein n=1 Tax=Rufibacter sp. XAAS-G3-1 TaxID=2729134 RepID=UPI0015E6D8A4|nr:hypothetical protein [Rufibacter sp. XAAS-G3-1]